MGTLRRLMALYISLKKTTHLLSTPSLSGSFFVVHGPFFLNIFIRCVIFSPVPFQQKSINKGAVCLSLGGLGRAFDLVLNWYQDAGYCLSFVMMMSDELGGEKNSNGLHFKFDILQRQLRINHHNEQN